MPETINGQFVFFHRPGGKGMAIDFIDDLEFDHGNYLSSDICISLNLNHWDNLKTGISGTPLKTPKGWLVFYHALGKFDHYYRVGCLLLDLKDLTKVVAKIENPVLEPELPYECQGQVNNVVFPCGQALVNNLLYVYYGAGDTCLAVATISLSNLLAGFISSPSKKLS